MRDKQSISLLVKEVGDDGTFTGLLAAYNNIDYGGDKILPGAFTKTIKDQKGEIPLLWQHKQDSPIGMLKLEDSPEGLRVQGRLLLEDETAMKAYRLLKGRIIKGLSIGYDAVKEGVENGVRLLKELRLWEGSVVTFPMNPLALIDGIKAMEQKDDFATELSAVQLQDAQYQIFSALWSALSSIPWSDASAEDKIAAGAQMCDDFKVAYMDYLPKYLDYLNTEYGIETMSRKRMKSRVIDMQLVLQQKEGRKFSKDTLDLMKKAHDHVKSTDEIFQTLLTDEADGDEDEDGSDDNADASDESDDTSGEKAARRPPEPEADHSQAEMKILDEIFETLAR